MALKFLPRRKRARARDGATGMSIEGIRAIAGAAGGRARLQRRGTLAIASLVLASFASAAAHAAPSSQRAAPRCLSECTPRIGIVSAFGAEAEILIAETRAPRSWSIGGNRFTTGVLRGNPVVIVLSGVSMVNAAMTTQRLLDHFRIERLVMSGIAGGIDPSRRVGDVLVPESWTMPMEMYWSHDAAPPAPCGEAGELKCLGLALARPEGRAVPPYVAPGASASGLFMRENKVVSAGRPEGEFVFDTGGLVACRIYRTLPARRMWDVIMSSTYDFAEPGFVLIDRQARRLGHRVPRRSCLSPLSVPSSSAHRASTWKPRRSPTRRARTAFN
jgi:hypothetical protein